jgi:hypothetical protein
MGNMILCTEKVSEASKFDAVPKKTTKTDVDFFLATSRAQIHSKIARIIIKIAENFTDSVSLGKGNFGRTCKLWPGGLSLGYRFWSTKKLLGLLFCRVGR